MGNNVVSVPFGAAEEIEAELEDSRKKKDLIDFMGVITQWCSDRGVDTSTKEYKHQAAVIMTQLQIIVMEK